MFIEGRGIMMRGRNLLALCFLLFGIALLLYSPIMNRFIIPKQLEKKYQVYNELDPALLKRNETIHGGNLFDFDDVSSVSANDINNAILNKDYIVGMVYVPNVDLKLPILYGATHENMLVGAGTLKANQQMGVGNYAIASHNAQNPNILFAPIRRIAEGDLMYTTDKENVYTYKMDFKEVIEPEKVEVIENQGRDELSLVSCYAADGSDRIIVKGELVEVLPIDEVDGHLKRTLLNM